MLMLIRQKGGEGKSRIGVVMNYFSGLTYEYHFHQK